ncbi:MAG: glycosyltransferase family 39 protein [Clostridia bacterium]|nr:glycosyltransferase family 39 protein [Clostridia bacterium]
MGYIILFSVIYSLIFVLLYRFAAKPSAAAVIGRKTTYKDYLPYAAGLLLIFILELSVSTIISGHKADIRLFKAWASFGNEHKMNEFYKTDLYVDYPPAYLIILYGVGKLAAFFGVDSASDAFIVWIKFIPILCDSIFSILIFYMAKDKFGLEKAGVISLMTAINPTMIINSAIWGQIDSFGFLIILAMLFTLYNRQYVLSCALFGYSILTKPQMIIFIPIIGFTMLFDLIEVFNDKEKRVNLITKYALSIVAFLAVVMVVSMPIVGTDYKLLIGQYTSAMGKYPYYTLNAANFYGAFGLNWKNVTESFFIATGPEWGFAFITAISLIVGYVTYKVRDRKKIFYLGAFMIAGIYLFAHTMHERYLYAAIPLLLIIYILTEDKRMLALYGGFSVINFINVARVLERNLQDDFIYGNDAGFILTSWIHLILFALMVIYSYQALFLNKKEGFIYESLSKKAVEATGDTPEGQTESVPTKTEKNIKKSKKIEIQKEEKPVKITRKDVLIMAGITLVYSVFAFYNLGSMNVPENGWYVEEAGQTVVFDFGKKQEINKLYMYPGWIDRRKSDSKVERHIEFELSNNGETWESIDALDIKSVWRWTTLKIDEKVRFVRMTCDDGRFYINELAFYGETEEDYIKPVSVNSDSEGTEALLDEKEKIAYEFSWYDGTYFDEIYHPRTAYEYLENHYPPYENTHPPLGKVIISWGIALFGMNPFGWRFFGTLCGVLMTPMAYMLGKRLFKTEFYAFCTAFLFTFDFMHLSQTRLATIDSFTAFFVMGMYYFMYRYISQSFYHAGVKKTLPSLFMSGLFFGLGAATKWQGIYAGTGLAFLFFASIFRRYLEYKKAQKSKNADPEMKRIAESFVPMATQSILCAALFFVGIPLLIYGASYLPIIIGTKGDFKYIINNQKTMLNYHGGLKSTHPYGSSWWSWPLDWRPLYAYSPNRSFIPAGTSMGISSFGNPLVWWMTIPAIGAAIVKTAKKKGDNELTLILAGFAAMYLPWVLVTRVAFIYHFFPCVIFVVLATVYFIREILTGYPNAKKFVYAYLIAVVLLFVVFYPVLTGMAVPTSYVEGLKWLPAWVLG